MSFSSNSPSFPATSTYAPPPDVPYLSMLLTPDSNATITAMGPTELTNFYLIQNLQTQVYEVCGTNLDGIDAYDYMI
jgi:hypothetical protein